MRLLFAGTPDPAVPSLRRLLASSHDVVAVLTRPDAPVGRGRRMSRSAVALAADEAGVPVLQPRTLRDPDAVAAIRDLAPDACPVVAYGAMIPALALAIPRHGWINLHFSLLPAWRGAAPVQHAIWHGDDLTGATAFRLDEGLDTGPVFGTMTEPVGPADTAGDLLDRLAVSGAELLLAILDGLERGEVVPVPQPADGVSLAPKISVEDARIDWTTPAVAVDRQVRACTPAPGAWTTFRDVRVKLLPVRPVHEPGRPFDKLRDRVLVHDEWPPRGHGGPGTGIGASLAPGQLVEAPRNRWLVGTVSGTVELGDVQPAGKKRMPAADWLRGLRPDPGESFA